MSDTRASRWQQNLQWIGLVVILAINAYLPAARLADETLRAPDEVCHAVVARNLLSHPLVPMLYRDAYLPPESQNAWLWDHIWLHKPPMALWQGAVSMALLGANTFAFRLPSLLLSCGAVALTFLIGRKVYDGWTGLLAALIQMLLPSIGLLVRGYVFSDAVDISLLFWTELSIFLMLSPSRWSLLASGVACGLAFLSKLYPALYVMAPLALLTWLRVRATPAPSRKTIWMGLAWWGGAVVLLAGSWTLYTALAYPREFDRESGMIFSHLTENVEQWAGRWDLVWFETIPASMLHFFTLAIVGVIWVTYRAIHERRWQGLLAPLWAMSVAIPFTLAVSKTPSATLCAWPALALCAAAITVRACRGFVVEAVVVTYVLILNIVASQSGVVFTNPKFGISEPLKIMREHIWILQHVVGASMGGILGIVVARKLVRRAQYPASATRQVSFVLILLLVLSAGAMNFQKYARSINVPYTAENYRAVGTWIDQHAPAKSAVLVVPTQGKLGHLAAMFWANRSCYPTSPQTVATQAGALNAAGASVYVIAPELSGATMVYEAPGNLRVYQLAAP